MPTYRMTTLGCRVNHAESREIESLLRDRGLTKCDAQAPADLEIIHTCTVTNKAAATSRHAIRRAIRRSQNGFNKLSDSQSHATFSTNKSRGAYPGVIVTGCYATTNQSEASQLAGGDDSVIEHTSSNDTSPMLQRLAERLDRWLDRPGRNCQPSIRTSDERCCTQILPLPVVSPTENAGRHIRAELKIQDGCDAHCTFCVIPKIRSTLRSKAIPEAIEETKQLVDLGHNEIVLTGIFIGAYGHETSLRRNQHNRSAQPLADLLDAVAQVPGLQRLRISSMEPGDVSEPLLDAMLANAPVVVPHLHLPLQSGSDAILKRMNRQYRVGDYLEMIDQVNETLTVDNQSGGHIRGWHQQWHRRPACDPSHPVQTQAGTPVLPKPVQTQAGTPVLPKPVLPKPVLPAALPPAITTDIICGFPGETEQDFAKTRAVAKQVGYLHMHIFPFSPKPGTAAARWKNHFVDRAVAKARVRVLIDLEDDPVDGLSINYRRRLLGRTVRVILEAPDKDDPSLMSGRCDHYALVKIKTNQPRGSIVRAQVGEVYDDFLFAEPIESRIPLPVLGDPIPGG